MQHNSASLQTGGPQHNAVIYKDLPAAVHKTKAHATHISTFIKSIGNVLKVSVAEQSAKLIRIDDMFLFSYANLPMPFQVLQ